jgi:hypothetical protein
VIFLAVDIGLTGAAAALDHTGRASVADLPIVDSPAGRRLHARGTLDILREWAPASEACVLVVEDVRPRPMGNGGAHGNTIFSQGSLMRGRGAVEALADIGGLPIVWVQPQTWKRHFALIGKDKDEGRQVALRLFPGMAQALARKLDHNRADALLLAHWGRSTQS